MELFKLRQQGFSWPEISIIYDIPIEILKMYLEAYLNEEQFG